jgi:type I restriction enzyme, S subunit
VKTVRLEELLDQLIDHRGKTPKKLGSDFTQTGVPVASAQLVADGVLDLADARCVDEETWRRWMPIPLEEGDVLLTSEAPLGRVAWVKSDAPLVLGQRLFALRTTKGRTDSRYLGYWLSSAEGQSALKAHATGSTVSGIRQSSLRRVEVPIRELDAQRAIGGVLGALDDKIAANRAIVDVGLELLDAKFGLASAGVERVRISSIAQVVLGGTPSRGNLKFWGGNVPWINSGACNARVITEASEMITGLGLEKSAAKLLPEGTTCVAITGATLGQMGWLVNSMAANQSVVGIVAESTDRLWVQLAVRSEREQLLGWATGGAQQHVNKNAVGSVEIAYESACAVRFGKENNALMRRVVLAKQESERLATTRDELLPLLMSGKVTIKDAEKTVEEVV